MRTRTSVENTTYQPNQPIAFDAVYWKTDDPNKDTWQPKTAIPLNVMPDRVVGQTISVISDEQVSAHRIKEVLHSRVSWRQVSPTRCDFGLFYPPNHSLSTINTLTGAFPLQNYVCGAYNWFPLPGEGNMAVTWGVTDEALLAAAASRLMDENEVDNFTNIREFEQTVGLVRGLGDKWKQLLLWVPSRRLLKKKYVPGLGRIVFVPDWSKADKFYSRKVQSTILATPGAISNGWLAYNFGVAPLVSDLRTMAVQMRSLESALKRLKYRSQRRFAHARCEGTVAVTGLGDEYYAPHGTEHASNRLRLHLSVKSAVKIATVQGKDTTSWNLDSFRNLDYMMKRFFSAGPGSALWEAIPYSFVLDWFVNSKAAIDAVDSSLGGSRRSVNAGCVSTKVDVEMGVQYSVSTEIAAPSYIINSANGATCGIVNMSQYHRKPADPSFWIGKSGRFGKKQVSLLAALLHQRVANLKVR